MNDGANPITRRQAVGGLAAATALLAGADRGFSAEDAAANAEFSPTLSITDAGAGIDRIVIIESAGQFRLGFSAGDNWGLDTWFDLVNDPAARTNLLKQVVTPEKETDEPGLFQQVFYGTEPDDPKLYTRSARYYFPDSPRSFEIIEHLPFRVIVEATSSPMVNAAGVLDNVVCKVRYEISPNGRLLITSTITAKEAQTAAIWHCGCLGLGDPTSVESIVPPDQRGWIRSSTTQDPYNFREEFEPYIYAYWRDDSGGPFAHWTKASVLLAPDPKNPWKGKQHAHNWFGFKRWTYSVRNLTMAPGQPITQKYLIQLGCEGSAHLPDIRTRSVASSIASAYIGGPAPNSLAPDSR